MSHRRKRIVRGVLGLLALAVILVLAQRSLDLPAPEQLLRDVRDRGDVAIPLLILVYALLSTLPAPTSLLSIAAGAVFGLGAGLFSVMVGAVLGATLAFGAVRVLGRDLVRGLENERIEYLDAEVARNGFLAVLLARLVPLFPFSSVNYAFGLTSVPLRSYVAATTIGIIPGATAYVAAGAYGTDPLSWSFLAAISALLGLTVIGGQVARRRRRALPASEETSED